MFRYDTLARLIETLVDQVGVAPPHTLPHQLCLPNMAKGCVAIWIKSPEPSLGGATHFGVFALGRLINHLIGQTLANKRRLNA
jgi:hypothetical protein